MLSFIETMAQTQLISRGRGILYERVGNALRLIVSLSGANHGVWSHLGFRVRDETLIFSAVSVYFGFAQEEIRKRRDTANSIISTFQGSNKARATPRLVSFKDLISNFRRASLPLSYGSPEGAYL